MLNRASIIALAAIAASFSLPLTSGSAFALRVSGGTSSTSGSTVHVNPAILHVAPGSLARLPHLTPVSPTLTPVTSPTPTLPPAVHIPVTSPTLPPAVHLDHDEHDADHDHDHDWWRLHHDHDWWVWWHRPRLGVVVDSPVSAVESVAAPSVPCNCLTKRYLDDGSVLFTDLCTKEQAMATPAELRDQAEGTPPREARTTR